MKIITIASGSSGNAYTVSDGKTTLLLEAGITAAVIGKKVKLDNVNACLITHEHMDHAKAARDLVSRYAIPVIASEGTLERLRLGNSFLAEKIKDGEEIRCESMVIKAFSVPHDAAEPLGWLIRSEGGEKLMFITDAYYIPIAMPRGLTHIMVECNYSPAILDLSIAARGTPHEQRERIRRSHMSIETVCDWLMKDEDRLRDVQDIRLLHISSRNGDPEAFRQRISELTGKVVISC